MPRIFTSPYPDIPIINRSIFTHVFSRSLEGKLPAYIDAPSGKKLSREDVHSQSLQLAWGLRNILHQEIGSTMAIFSPNSLWWPIVLFSGIAAGLRVTTINSAYTPSEVVHQLKDSRAYVIFAHPSLLNIARAALKDMGVKEAEIRKRIVLAGSVGPDAYEGVDIWQRVEHLLGKNQLAKEVPMEGDNANETALLCYSSGTTSFPKGVELTHRNMVSQPLIVERSFFWHIQPHDSVILGVLPFFHIYGLIVSLLIPLVLGAPVVLMSSFNPEDFCANIERYKVTFSFVVPPILVMLANHPATEKYDLGSLKGLFSAAAPLGPDLVLNLISRFKGLGIEAMVLQAYGLTESSAASHFLDDVHWKTKMGSIGHLLPNLRARIVLDDGETDARDGEAGELWLHGPTMMKGYLNNPKATEEAITPDGWFKTGDVAVIDQDGCFNIIDRKKELIKYKGFQVPPAELENILLTHPMVIDAGVIGIYSDSHATEYPRAYVVPRGGVQALSTPHEIESFEKGVQTWIQSKVAQHKYLRGGVVVVDAIPKSAAGKILRRQLRDLAKKELVLSETIRPKL